MYPELQGKVAVVTGSGRADGLGEAIARRLAREGVKVVVHDRGAMAEGVASDAEMQAVAAAIRAEGGEAAAFAADMTREDEVEALMGHAVQTYGRLDILVNNAGVGFMFGPLLEFTQAQWDMVLDVNLRGAFFALKHAARQMQRQEVQEGWGRGRIVSIASRAAKSGGAFTAAYVASKHGLVGLTRSAATELGPQQITVNAVCPNHVTTKLGAWQNDFMTKAKGFDSVESYLADMTKRIPLGRVGVVDDTANACAFICSGAASYITGEAMNVSGGEEYH